MSAISSNYGAASFLGLLPLAQGEAAGRERVRRFSWAVVVVFTLMNFQKTDESCTAAALARRV